MKLYSCHNIPKLLLTSALAICAVVGYWGAVAWTPSFIDQISHINAVNEKSAANFCMSIGGIAGCFFTPLLLRYFGIANGLKISFLGTLLSAAAIFLSFKTYSPLLSLLCLIEGFFGIQSFNLLSIWVPQIFGASLRGTASWHSLGHSQVRCCRLHSILYSVNVLFDGSYGITVCCIASACYLPGILFASFIKEAWAIPSDKQFGSSPLPNT